MKSSALLVLGCAVLLSGPQPPRIIGGEVTTRALGSPLVASFNGLVGSLSEVTWIGYSVPSPRREGFTCCFNSGDGQFSGTMTGSGPWAAGCRLEPGAVTKAAGQPAPPSGPIKLEGPDRANILFRIEGGRVERIRAFSEGCDLDAGGRAVIWLDQVQPADSVALLASIATGATRRDRTVNGALSAIGMHAAPEAGSALVRLARDHATPAIRGEAIFWLAQRAGEKAAAEITARIDDDPDTEVKRRAVFALSTLPKDESVPLLIRIARTHQNAAVRKQAFFWLGQSKDPRAVEFFAEILR